MSVVVARALKMFGFLLALALFAVPNELRAQSGGGFFSSIVGAIKQGVQQGINQGLGTGQATSGTATLPPSLQGLFLSAQFNYNISMDSQYPRVALTVLASPPNHAENIIMLITQGATVPRACWQLEARVWTNSNTFNDVQPFTVCMPDIVSQIAYSPFTQWAMPDRIATIPAASTGRTRTLGPVPPDNAFPDDIRYAAYYGASEGMYPDEGTEEWFMFASVLYDMGFDWHQTSDHRVWIYKYVPVEG